MQALKMPSCQILKNKDLYLWPLEKKIIRMREAFSSKQSYPTTLCNPKTDGVGVDSFVAIEHWDSIREGHG